MSAVLTPRPPAQVAVGEAPSCRTCRHSAFHAQSVSLRCRQMKSPVGQDVIACKTGLTEAAYEQRCMEVAARCRIYQEER